MDKEEGIIENTAPAFNNSLLEALSLEKYRYLWILIFSYAMIFMYSNWFCARLIRFLSVSIDGGTLVFPFTFILADIITEVYGYKKARLAIWVGFFFNLIYLLYGQIITHLPSPEYYAQSRVFDEIISVNVRIIFASMLTYFVAESLNILILAKLKVRLKGKLMGLRFLLSTCIAASLDSIIFGFLAFFQVISFSELCKMILTMWIIKILIEFICLPISTSIARKLKKAEKIDVYDYNTSFNLFRI